jgi:hypothetical protein
MFRGYRSCGLGFRSGGGPFLARERTGKVRPAKRQCTRCEYGASASSSTFFEGIGQNGHWINRPIAKQLRSPQQTANGRGARPGRLCCGDGHAGFYDNGNSVAVAAILALGEQRAHIP